MKVAGLCPAPHSGDFLRREGRGALPHTPLRGLLKEKSPKNLQDLQPIYIFNSFFTWFKFRCSRIPCYEFRLLRDQSRRAGLARRQLVALPSLRYRIEMVQVSEWAAGGLICGALLADCAPEKSVPHQKMKPVGNDPCVVPFRLKDTFAINDIDSHYRKRAQRSNMMQRLPPTTKQKNAECDAFHSPK